MIRILRLRRENKSRLVICAALQIIASRAHKGNEIPVDRLRGIHSLDKSRTTYLGKGISIHFLQEQTWLLSHTRSSEPYPKWPRGPSLVAVAALAAVSGVCSIGKFLNCLVAAIASVMVVIISGFCRGRTGETGAGLLDRSVDLLSTVQHHFPNGTVVQGFQPAWLEVGRDHKVTVGNHFETIATRLESGHVRISARVNQGQGLGQGLSRFLNIWTRTDDNPGDTGFIDVLFNDLDIGGTGLQNDGGTTELSNQVGEAVASTIINDQAETVCAALINPNTNGEIIATEWFIRAGDGSSGSTPSDACDNA